jgi:hypothetical protein
MPKLRKRLSGYLNSLGIQKALHARAVKRMQGRHDGQKKAEGQAEAAVMKADELRAEGHTARAARKDAKAGKLNVKVEKEKTRAVFWRGKTRDLAKRVAGVETDIAAVRKEIAALGPRVDTGKSKVTGGSFAERWRLSNLTSVECCSSARRRNAYSQVGHLDISHPYGPGPAAGMRDDCSSYITSQALATGAGDPNNSGFDGQGYTGTLVSGSNGWKEVNLERMIKARQGYIVYGSGDGHHVEAYCPSESDSSRTVGHGSAPVDVGMLHAFGTSEVERYFIYDPD